MKIVRTILFIINVVLAIGLILTTLAGGVAPSRSIYPSVLAFCYLPMLAANVVMMVIWVLMGKWHFLLSALAIGVRYSFLPLFFQVGGTSQMPADAEGATTVSLMTYNVHNFQGSTMEPTNIDSNAAEFVKVVREASPEVLCLQEYVPGRKVSVTDSLELMGFNHYYATVGGSGNSPRNVVVFSRLPITYVKRVDRTKLIVEVMKDDRKMRLCCVHMDSYKFDTADLHEVGKMIHGEVEDGQRRVFSKVKHAQLRHEEEWETLLKPLVSECSIPMVLAGDMNDIPSSYLYHQITRYMTDAYCEKGSGMSITYNGGFPSFRIDMVFHNSGLQTVAYRRIRTEVSDHYPVMVCMKFVDERREQ